MAITFIFKIWIYELLNFQYHLLSCYQQMSTLILKKMRTLSTPC